MKGTFDSEPNMKINRCVTERSTTYRAARLAGNRNSDSNTSTNAGYHTQRKSAKTRGKRWVEAPTRHSADDASVGEFTNVALRSADKHTWAQEAEIVARQGEVVITC